MISSNLTVMGGAFALVAPGGLIRLFVDEGPPMAALLREAVKGDMPRRLHSRCWRILEKRLC